MKHLAIILILLFTFSTVPMYGKNPGDKRQTIEVEFSQKEPQSKLDMFFEHFKDLFGPAVALFGILIAQKILRKKLIENHITTKLNKIQQKNSEVQTYNQKLIDKYQPLKYSQGPLSKQDIENVLQDIIKGYHIAQKGSSDVATLMFYLKVTLQKSLKHYDPRQSKSFFTIVFLSYIHETLELVNFYSTQVVQIPKSSKTIRHNLIKKSLRKYVTLSNVTQYKHFKMGIINDPNSAHYTMFCGVTNRTKHPLLMRSAFQIYYSPNAIAKHLFINRIYAPSVLESQKDNNPWGTEKTLLFLVGFSISTELRRGADAPKQVVDLVYTNPKDFYLFIDSLNHGKLKSDFSDGWIGDSNFKLEESTKMIKSEIETFRLKYDKEYLEKMFKTNKRKIKKMLNKTKRNSISSLKITPQL